ncbi:MULTISPECIES: hypothetical protein [unclassified Colwellia]|uniref:hypothetical protein n=1 Tax=unclassified Colwellia TaxID=196834 RepID=UPI0015F57FAD|nr:MULTISPECIES: hypothetical protein [unclassified Colwellia]MBA6232365.1 hypothetical protein [Colwellia sp. MB02u-7]MBA6236041.1 hypothetical protein [Colwellia sp. MB02u-11]MBA6256705.1 hypothetical protein [Colwellia sp. MB3u-28]MBA6261420.1 hypothetical protein [Colwellia sp. MB3u-41]MBA6298554.1 hypothetical protein [Colwellia sp. MB3u-22]
MYDLEQEEKYAIERYLNAKIAKWGAIIGIVNLIALFGIYYSISDTVAEKATNRAIEQTEEKMSSSAKQLEKLTDKAISSLFDAIKSSGEAEAHAKSINKNILELQALDLDKVGQIVVLLNQSKSEIEALINSSQELKKSEIIFSKLHSVIKENNANIKTLKTHLTKIQESSSKYITKREVSSAFENRISSDINKNNILLSLNKIQIEAGESAIEPIKSGNSEKYIKFNKEYSNPPYVTASNYGNSNKDSGYPIIYDVTSEGFNVKVIDSTSKRSISIKYDLKFSYVVIGESK